MGEHPSFKRVLIVLLLMVSVLATPAESWWRRRRRRRSRPPPVCPSVSSASYRVQSCTNNCYVGSSCTFNCQAGYRLSRSTPSVCQSNCVWSPAFPTCTAITCPAIPTASHRLYTCTNGRNYNSRCTFSCSTGYRPVGSTTSTCGSNGAWSSSPPTCQVITCSPRLTSVTNGRVRCTNSNLLNSVCTYSCNNGYVFGRMGSETRICGESGWSGTLPTCVHNCPTIPVASHRYHSCTDGLLVNSRCTFGCLDGHRLVGTEASTCMWNCVWSQEFPTCEVFHTCPAIPSCIYRSYTCTDDMFVGSVCTYRCQRGYELVGSTRLTCGDNCAWDHAFPTCEVPTCRPRITECQNGDVSCTNENEINSVCTFSCNNGYIFAPGDDESCTCNENGWSGSPPNCISVIIQ